MAVEAGECLGLGLAQSAFGSDCRAMQSEQEAAKPTHESTSGDDQAGPSDDNGPFETRWHGHWTVACEG